MAHPNSTILSISTSSSSDPIVSSVGSKEKVDTSLMIPLSLPIQTSSTDGIIIPLSGLSLGTNKTTSSTISSPIPLNLDNASGTTGSSIRLNLNLSFQPNGNEKTPNRLKEQVGKTSSNSGINSSSSTGIEISLPTLGPSNGKVISLPNLKISEKNKSNSYQPDFTIAPEYITHKKDMDKIMLNHPGSIYHPFDGQVFWHHQTRKHIMVGLICEKGHPFKFDKTLASRGHWCNICRSNESGRPRATIELARSMANNMGGYCLSLECNNNRDKLQWQCSYGHTWIAIYSSVRQGSWCPTCQIEQTKLPIQEVLTEIETKGGKLLSEYINSSTKLLILCFACGNTFSCSFGHIRRDNSWCNCQSSKRIITIEHCRAAAAAHGGKVLSQEYINNKTKLEWKCHIDEHPSWWTTPSAVLYRNGWCPYCARKAPLTLEQCQQKARLRGGILLSREYINCKTKMEWKCHIEEHPSWWAGASSVLSSNQWCLHCCRRAPLTLEQCQQKARSRGGELLSQEYINIGTKMTWKCGIAEHPPWEATANSILNRGTWCSHCSGNAKLSLSDCQKKAAEMGGQVLSLEYINSETRMLWKCGISHHAPWMTTPNHIFRGSWCPICKCSRGEREISNILVKHNITFETQYQIDQSIRRYYDFYIPSLKTIIEYDGMQHFYTAFSMVKTEERLLYRQQVDSFKTNLAISNGLNMIRIDYTFLGNIEPWLITCLNWISQNQIRGQLVFTASGSNTPVHFHDVFDNAPPLYQWYDNTIMENPGSFQQEDE